MNLKNNFKSNTLSQDTKSNKNAIKLLKLIVQSEKDIKNGNVVNQEEMFKNLEKSFSF